MARSVIDLGDESMLDFINRAQFMRSPHLALDRDSIAPYPLLVILQKLSVKLLFTYGTLYNF